MKDLVNAHELKADGELVPPGKGDKDQKCRRAIERIGDAKRGPQPDTIKMLVPRLLGLLPVVRTDPLLWKRPSGAAARRFAPILNSVLTDTVLLRIGYQCEPSGPKPALDADIRAWVEYLLFPDSKKPGACWTRDPGPGATGVAEVFERPYDYIPELLSRVAVAKSTVTFAAVSFSETIKHGTDAFLEALGRGTRVRFLIFDILNGDCVGMAAKLGLDPDALKLRSTDTVEALRALSRNACAGAGKLEVRVSRDDLLGCRIYIVDEGHSHGLTYVCQRYPGTLEAPGYLVRHSDLGMGIAPHYARHVQRAWDQSQELDAKWIENYERWCSDERASGKGAGNA